MYVLLLDNRDRNRNRNRNVRDDRCYYLLDEVENMHVHSVPSRLPNQPLLLTSVQLFRFSLSRGGTDSQLCTNVTDELID